MMKSETREIAKKLDLNVADKPAARYMFCTYCDYVSYKKFKPDAFIKGNIKNKKGEVLVHDGIANFTIGQRKGIKVPSQDPYYVDEINSDKNEIIVGSRKDLLKKEIKLKDLNLLVDKEFFDKEIFVKVRSTGKLLKSKLKVMNGVAELNLLEDEYGISPGQACVFYEKDSYGDKVLGGGWIVK